MRGKEDRKSEMALVISCLTSMWPIPLPPRSISAVTSGVKDRDEFTDS